MATSLRDNLTSSYFNAAHKLYPKKARRRIIAYVESYDDIAFWRTLLEEFEDDEHYFQVMLPSATSLAKGKKMVLMNTLNTAELGRSLIASGGNCKNDDGGSKRRDSGHYSYSYRRSVVWRSY